MQSVFRAVIMNFKKLTIMNQPGREHKSVFSELTENVG